MIIYKVTIIAPGLESTIVIEDQDDFAILDKLLEKIKRDASNSITPNQPGPEQGV